MVHRRMAPALVFVALILSVTARAAAGDPLAPKAHVTQVNGKPVAGGAAVETALGRSLSVTFDAEPDKNPVLFLDNEAIPGLVVRRAIGGDPTLIFDLARTADNDAIWRRLLARHHGSYAMAVGFPDATTAVVGAPVFLARVPVRSVAWAAAALFVLTLIGAVCVVRAGGLQDAGKWSSFSLGRMQMLFWTLLVTGAFLILWAVTGDIDTLTSQALVLMGISGTTALGAAVIDKTKNAASLAKIADARTAAGPEKATPPASVETAIQASAFQPSNVIMDVLGGADGLSLHRLQMLVWTLVLGAIFVVDVFRDLAMPQFSDTLLTLMGISAGTYVGFKFPEAG